MFIATTQSFSTMELLHYVLLTISIVLILKLFSKKRKNLPPSPFALPIIGHLHLFKQPFYRTLLTLSNRYGEALFVRFGTRPVLFISSPTLVEECFTKNDIIFANRPSSVAGDHFSYNYTIFAWSPYGYLWRNTRRIATIEIFSSKSLQLSSTIRKEEIHRLVNHLYLYSNGGSRHFNFKSMFSKLMFNVVMRMVSGKRCFEEFGELEEHKELLGVLKEIFLPSMTLNVEDFLPILKWIGLYHNREKSRIILQKKRDSFMEDMINDHRRQRNISTSDDPKSEEKKKMVIIDALLSIQEAEPEQYNDDFIKGIILTMFTAGTDTTSLTMEWALSALLNNPSVLEKAKSEIDKHVQGRLLDDADLSKLRYLHCIINETLRLYPAAPLLVPHSSSEECTIGGYHVPRGTILYANIWAIQRDPKVWVEPEKFMPERFLDEKDMGFKFVPFGVGRRGCPGAAMAMRVVALGLGTLIQCFEWQRIGEEQVDMNEAHTGVTMPKALPLIAKCKPRSGFIDALSQL